VLAGGGPGELFETSVYPRGQWGLHGAAFKAGLAAENLTEWQFGLASIGFRWNVSGTYMQAVPRIFSTDADGNDGRDFLSEYFPSASRLGTATFFKGYEWPFDVEKVTGCGSSLIDVLVHRERQKGRRVWLDYRRNCCAEFSVDALGPEPREYLRRAGATQATPIERLEHMNPLAVEIYAEHNIDLHSEPIEVAVCAQHNNGGFAVDAWWQSNVRGTFVIGEMAGTHGVRRPGGAALNAGQVGGLRAAKYIANVCGAEASEGTCNEQQLGEIIGGLQRHRESEGLEPGEVIRDIKRRMTEAAGHVHRLSIATKALGEAIQLYKSICRDGLRAADGKGLVDAVRAEQLALAGVGYLKAVVEYLEAGGGSRGSYMVLDDGGVEIHPELCDERTGKPLRFKQENEMMRNKILRMRFDAETPDFFRCEWIRPREVKMRKEAFETAWREFREGKIYRDGQ
jgi:succinate dehydrogenase/fumarate reductase flavoprotein subunit